MSAQAYYHALRAALAEAKGDLPAAAEALQLALVYDHESLELTLRLGRVSLALDRVGRARKMADKARRLRPRRPAVALLRADVALAEGRIDKARKILARAERRETEGIEIAMKLGRLLLDQGGPAAAVPVLRRAVNRLPQSTQALQLLAEVYQAQGNLRAAVKTLSRALARSPADTSVRMHLGDVYERKGRLEDAFELWRHDPEGHSQQQAAILSATRVALLLNDRAPDLRLRLSEASRTQSQRELVAMMLTEVGHFRAALPLLKAALVHSPASASLDLALGRTLYSLGEDKLALSVLERVSANAPDAFVAARAFVAQMHIGAGRHQRARLALQVALHRFPKAPALVAQLAIAHARQGDPQQALRVIEEADLPGSLPVVRARASILSARDGVQATIEALEAEADSPPSVLRVLGEFELGRGNLEKAGVWFKRTRGAFADDAELAGDIALASLRPKVALREALRGLALSPRSAEVMDRLGRVYLRAGDLQHARAYLLRAGRLAPRDPYIMEHIGDMHGQSAPRLAVEAWRKARTYWRGAQRAQDPQAGAALTRLNDKLRGVP